jgi:hypothetical protein
MRRLLINLLFFVCWLSAALSVAAQEIRVNPTGVNVNSQGVTTVFLTFGNLRNYRPVEAAWCGELIPAAPALGNKCDPSTIFGSLPVRFDLSTQSGNQAFTDIMSIPASVARRAYQAATTGADSRFFYVRRFVHQTGAGPDQYVAVTCRLTGGGARVPFALTEVKLAFDAEALVLYVKPGEKLPSWQAEISYNGTGRLKGRWEVVLPGEELPETRDLLTEASLPIEERALQRRYTQLERFNVFLPPTGKYTLLGPDVARLPNTAEGLYLLLLRVEAADDKEGDSNLAAVGAGAGIVHSGAVAGFPLPVLRYFVGGSQSTGAAAPVKKLALLQPGDEALLANGQPLDFSWVEDGQAVFYRLEVEDAQNKPLLSALLPSGTGVYRAPSWLKEQAGLRWRVLALDRAGKQVGETGWRRLKLVAVK